jgi:hypothetical protein
MVAPTIISWAWCSWVRVGDPGVADVDAVVVGEGGGHRADRLAYRPATGGATRGSGTSSRDGLTWAAATGGGRPGNGRYSYIVFTMSGRGSLRLARRPGSQPRPRIAVAESRNLTPGAEGRLLRNKRLDVFYFRGFS